MKLGSILDYKREKKQILQYLIKVNLSELIIKDSMKKETI